MLDWDATARSLGFKTELQMWRTLIVSLRNSEAIAKYLGVSRGAVQRRRQILNLHTTRRGKTYRKTGKAAVLSNLPDEVWVWPIEDIIVYVMDKFDIVVSKGYVSKYRALRRGGK